MGVGGQRHAPTALSPWKEPGTHCTGGSVGPRTDAENLTPTGTRFPDRPARKEFLYRLSYPAHRIIQDVLPYSSLHSVNIYTFSLNSIIKHPSCQTDKRVLRLSKNMRTSVSPGVTLLTAPLPPVTSHACHLTYVIPVDRHATFQATFNISACFRV
jgi:hypothetical protein